MEAGMSTQLQIDSLPAASAVQPGLVAVAMSGGVDSSTVAAVLLQQGRPVVGLTMQLWNQRRLPELQGEGPAQHRCCSLDDVYDAKRVAQHLNFPHYVVNFEDKFEQRVVRPFVEQYLAGRTPIACTNCNTDVKFEPLLRMARQIGAELLATGHYARIRRNDQTGRYELLRARDDSKDQSYFLWGLTQEQLSRSEFPLGELTKEEVRALAREVNLPVAEKPESMELCFVPHGNYVQFIHAYAREVGKPISDAEGNIGIDPEKNRIIVGEDDSLRTTSFEIENVNWISIAEPSVPLRAHVKIRHRHDPSPAIIEALPGNSARITFDSPQRAITPGQAAAIYSGDVVLAGGWIK
jgi:tRNA-uridine 2-sulfurtransferase